MKILSEKDIRRILEKLIFGQESAKNILSKIAHRHYSRIIDDGIDKKHGLALGPKGCGKKHLAKATAEAINLPIAFIEADSLLDSIRKGRSLETALKTLFDSKKDASNGIIYINNIDKLCHSEQDNQKARCAVEEILKIIKLSGSEPEEAKINGLFDRAKPKQLVDLLIDFFIRNSSWWASKNLTAKNTTERIFDLIFKISGEKIALDDRTTKKDAKTLKYNKHYNVFLVNELHKIKNILDKIYLMKLIKIASRSGLHFRVLHEEANNCLVFEEPLSKKLATKYANSSSRIVHTGNMLFLFGSEQKNEKLILSELGDLSIVKAEVPTTKNLEKIIKKVGKKEDVFLDTETIDYFCKMVTDDNKPISMMVDKLKKITGSSAINYEIGLKEAKCLLRPVLS